FFYTSSSIILIACFIYFSISNTNNKAITTAWLLLNLIVFISLVFKNTSTALMLFYSITISIFSYVAFKSYHLSNSINNSELDKPVLIPVILTTFILTTIIFGKFIYKEIPVFLGGAQPYLMSLNINESEVESLVKSGSIAGRKQVQSPLKIIYVSEKYCFVELENKIISIPSESIKSFSIPK
ncbi:MAG TPA: hypothetical protein VIQ31_33720, partial [Phormidium sp.]